VAADDRIARYRHPLPTYLRLLEDGGPAPIARYVMLVGCFEREGLVVSMTRFRQLDDVPDDLTRTRRTALHPTSGTTITRAG